MQTILVVDDDRSMRCALKNVLKEHHFQVLEASSGSAAIELCSNENPSAILLDLAMPGMSGIEVMERLKPICEDVPIIVISGHADIPTAVASMKLGAYDFRLFVESSG